MLKEKLKFIPRYYLNEFLWDSQKKEWKRIYLEQEVLKNLSKRNTINGLLRVALLFIFLLSSAFASIYISKYNLLFAIPIIYIYYFFFGFLVAIGHELQHKTVFDKNFDWLNEILFFIVQTLIWNSPRYARISHRLHHRYTMVFGVDPETNWPEVITTKWLKNYLRTILFKFLIIGAIVELIHTFILQVKRILGIRDAMMKNHCSDRDILIIRIESFAIILIQLSIVAIAILLRRWELIIFITLAWQIGSSMEGLYHSTEHIGRMYNVNDHRLCTRSIKVNSLIKLIFWGLDDHVEHHIYPVVPSYNLPKLHKILCNEVTEPKNLINCWKEMFEIAREKDLHPENEYVPIKI